MENNHVQYYSNLIGKSDVSAFCLGKNLGVQPRYQTQFFRRDFSHLQFLQVKGKNNFSRFGLKQNHRSLFPMIVLELYAAFQVNSAK